ncbi:MAG TPA: TldD/PmbA family protein [Aliidongia sp.]|uniref:TldD/PmbA family protein n=1 Tax=Aliidongia sp. TaxID=1914230 RepID=UPI002DDD9A29|nr:TldD/PmbA family protein [Aliidongia sp.]HEV2676544.1 TldD/PmbA family protein [Aliidongia sp.]
MTPTDQALDLLTDLIARAKRAGADQADGVLFEGISIAHAQRLGEIEKLERSEGYDLGLRVLIGKRQAIVSSNDRTASALDALVERAIAMARVVPEDEFCGIADPDQIARTWPELDMVDPDEPATAVLIDRATRAEQTARGVAGVTNSDGAEASWSYSRVALAASNGFAGGYAGSGHGVSVSVIAGTGDGMEREYDYSSAVYGADLDDPHLVGQRAGERAVRRVGARKMPTAKVPVVYDPRVASGLVGHLAGAISGPSIARKTSFLKDKLGQRLFPAAINIIDDPHRQRGHRSKPFDGEGIANQRRALIEDGVLTTWLLDLRSARQLGLTTTGHASRGTSGPPGPSTTNLYLAAGTVSPKDLIADIESGLYITSLMGQGINGVTGDYSRGASGFWIERGEIAFPVNEITVAGNLIEMFQHVTAANDLEFHGGTNAPTLRVDGMTVAGA